MHVALVPVIEVPGGELKPAVAIPDDDLRAIVERHLQPLREANTALDETVALGGGLALHVDGAMRLRPQCCCDLGDVHAWLELTDLATDVPSLRWGGHPNPRVWRERGSIILSCQEDGDEYTPPAERRIEVERAALRRAVGEAVKELHALDRRLRRALADAYSETVLRRLVWAAGLIDAAEPIPLPR